MKGKAKDSALDGSDFGSAVDTYYEDIGGDDEELVVISEDDEMQDDEAQDNGMFKGGCFSKDECKEIDEIFRNLLATAKSFGQKHN